MSLLEVVIVIAIIAILFGILLVALRKTETVAKGNECQNNLRQMALAMLNYETTNGSLPAGNVIPEICCETKQPKGKENWAVSILPFLEQKALFEQYRPDAYCEDQPEGFRTAFVKTFACPEDRDVGVVSTPFTGPGKGISFMPSSYRGMSGRGSDDGDRFFTQPQESLILQKAGKWHWRGPLHSLYVADRTKSTLVGPEKTATITDGMSNTILIGEYTTITEPGRRAFWAYSHNQYPLSGAVPYRQILTNSYLECVDDPNRTFDNDACKVGWGSMHPGGINFAFCDGSVHFIRTTIDMELFCNLATIAGGETVGGEF